MNDSTGDRADARSTEQARRDLGKAEAGDAAGADRLHDKEPAAEVAEQEASDGPGKRGVSR